RGARDVPPGRRDRATGRRPGALGPQRPRLRRGGVASALGAERGRRPTPHRAYPGDARRPRRARSGTSGAAPRAPGDQPLLGAGAAAAREIGAWAQIAGELRQPRYLTHLAMWRATRAIMDGRFAEGEEHARRALELGEREPEVEPAMRHAVQMAVLQFHRGQF